jgi:hypothetical protein
MGQKLQGVQDTRRNTKNNRIYALNTLKIVSYTGVQLKQQRANLPMKEMGRMPPIQ